MSKAKLTFTMAALSRISLLEEFSVFLPSFSSLYFLHMLPRFGQLDFQVRVWANHFSCVLHLVLSLCPRFPAFMLYLLKWALSCKTLPRSASRTSFLSLLYLLFHVTVYILSLLLLFFSLENPVFVCWMSFCWHLLGVHSILFLDWQEYHSAQIILCLSHLSSVLLLAYFLVGEKNWQKQNKTKEKTNNPPYYSFPRKS